MEGDRRVLARARIFLCVVARSLARYVARLPARSLACRVQYARVSAAAAAHMAAATRAEGSNASPNLGGHERVTNLLSNDM